MGASSPNLPVILAILDGWGIRTDSRHNAIALARTPNLDRLRRDYLSTVLHASQTRIGFPEGREGNSEVGHIILGAGRVVEMDVTRIDRSIEDGSFYRNPVLADALEHARQSRLHLVGLLSDGGVHSREEHLRALIRLARLRGLSDVVVHPALDGRDAPPTGGADCLLRLLRFMKDEGVGRIGSVCGRYYSMDRDRHWDRTRRAYDALVRGSPCVTVDPVARVRALYAQGISDEFIEPFGVSGGRTEGRPRAGRVRDGDVLLFFNFRADRMRQIVAALSLPGFEEFPRQPRPSTLACCLTEYDGRFRLPVAFPPRRVTDTLGEVLGRNGLRSLRIAETEKYAHVTYFFNGGEEREFPGERRILVPSPRVATYDRKPEMSAAVVTERLLGELDEGTVDVAIVNFANADLVGHTGNLDAAVRAVEALDACIGRIAPRVAGRGGALLITSDHGNAELMYDAERGEAHTAHTTNPVPFLLVSDRYDGELRSEGSLEDVAPTILSLLEVEVPPGMTGRSLLRAAVCA